MDAEVPFADAKRDDTQTPASVDAMPETDCNSTTKESAIHEANDCAAQFARVDEKDHNTGSGSELPYVKCAVIGVASPEENFPPCTIDKILEIMTTEAPLSAPADIEASDKAAVVPKVRANECKKTELLSEKRRRVWLARINRGGTMDPDKFRVCLRHFLSASEQYRRRKKTTKLPPTRPELARKSSMLEFGLKIQVTIESKHLRDVNVRASVRCQRVVHVNMHIQCAASAAPSVLAHIHAFTGVIERLCE
ncbi:hypothetical protein HPB50_023123 [Hyalomma asiaticum]|uniref:Uncharacterized protein n=1 Tax=Hyalomma asiaticum TaxID=266040 RepID=A0ACB7TMG3_HYAAI|nr:hypothetical protein HPB50_023123 [Hyalomma asiaticum]